MCSCVYDIISRQFINMIFSGGGFIDALLIIGLPNGPTAHFKLSKLVFSEGYQG